MGELNPQADRSPPYASSLGPGHTVATWLAGVRVLDLSRSVAGGFCAKLLAEYGARVWRQGVAGTGAAPSSPLRPALAGWLHGEKALLPCDFPAAFAESDVVVWDWDEPASEPAPEKADHSQGAGSQPPGLRPLDPRLPGTQLEVLVRDTSGPGNASNDGTPEHNASLVGGLHAAVGVLLALLAKGGLSEQRGLLESPEEPLSESSLPGPPLSVWVDSRAALASLQQPGASNPSGRILRCRDGWLVATITPSTPSELLAALTGDAAFNHDPRLAMPAQRTKHAELAFQRLGAWVADQPRDGAVARAQMLQLPFGRVRSPGEVVAEPHYLARGLWPDPRFPSDGPSPFSGLPICLVTSPASSQPGHDSRQRGRSAFGKNPAAQSSAGQRRLPLAGLRVLELSAAWAGPLVGRWLADYGAEVARVEWRMPDAPEPPSDAGELHRGKASVALDCSTRSGQETLRCLATKADLVVENFRPGVLEAWGCGWTELSACNPDLLMLSLSGFGRGRGEDTAVVGEGPPLNEWRVLGPTLEGECGWASLCATPQGMPRLQTIPLTDPVAALNGLVALLAALFSKLYSHQASPQDAETGAYLDLSQAACALRHIAPQLAAAAANPVVTAAAVVGPEQAVRSLGVPRGETTAGHDPWGAPLTIAGLQPPLSAAPAYGADTRRVLREWLGQG